ncbi:hypothetical protein DV736_g1470, partial [Chaetothyriales sp. CBS 134916]
MDVLPQQSGPLLDSWIHDNVYTNVLRQFMVHCPSLLVPSWLEENGHFVEEKMHRDHFPCMPALQLRVAPSSPSSGVKSCNYGSGSGGGRKKPFRHCRSSVAEQLGRIDEPAEIVVSATAPPAPSARAQEQLFASSLAGWIHYQRLYANFLPPIHALGDPYEDEKLKLPDWSRDWWLGDEKVRDECDRTKPFFEMATFVDQTLAVYKTNKLQTLTSSDLPDDDDSSSRLNPFLVWYNATSIEAAAAVPCRVCNLDKPDIIVAIDCC